MGTKNVRLDEDVDERIRSRKHPDETFSDAIDLLIQSGRTIDAIRLDGWRIDVRFPEDRDRAEERLDELVEEDDDTEPDGDEAVIDARSTGDRAVTATADRAVTATAAINLLPDRTRIRSSPPQSP